MGIYHVNATMTRAISGTEMAGSEKCDGFYQIISELMSND